MAIVEVWSKKPAEGWPDQGRRCHVEVDRHHKPMYLTSREMDAFAQQIVDTVVAHPEILRNR